MSLTMSSIRSRCSERCGCRIWNGAVSGDGYPFVYDPDLHSQGRKQSMVPVRRWVWTKVNGPIPAGKVIVLTCRNRLCVEPGHMEAKTNKEARLFAAEAGAYQSTACRISRVVNGRKVAKFDMQTAKVIRSRAAAGETRGALAAEYAVDRSVIDRIADGTRYVERMAPNASVFHQVA